MPCKNKEISNNFYSKRGICRQSSIFQLSVAAFP